MVNIIKDKKGFTLIELLVVVAIIGILASVVFSALNNARDKGSDGAVKANLTDARGQAEVFFNTNTASPNTYTNVCTNGSVGGVNGIGVFVLTAARAVGLSAYGTNATGTTSVATCNDSTEAWAAEVPMKTAGEMWCVDSTGKSKEESTSIGAGTACL